MKQQGDAASTKASTGESASRGSASKKDRVVKPAAKSVGRPRCADAKTKPQQASRPTTPPPKQTLASPAAATNPKKNLSGEFAKAAASNENDGTLLASPATIKSPYPKKARTHEDLEP